MGWTIHPSCLEQKKKKKWRVVWKFQNPAINVARKKSFFNLKTFFQSIIDPKSEIKNLPEPRHVFLGVFKVKKTHNINSFIIWNFLIQKSTVLMVKILPLNNFLFLSRNLTPLSLHHLKKAKEKEGDILVFQIN